MTEDEAKTKECRVGGLLPSVTMVTATTGNITGPSWPRCSASACGHWRWVGSHINDPDFPDRDMIWSGRTYGHCGLAGDVEPTKASSLEYRRANPDPTPPAAA